MKKLLLILPILFSSACSSATYVSECYQREKNFINNDLKENYNIQKTAFINEKNDVPCAAYKPCLDMQNNLSRWEVIEINLPYGGDIFPNTPGIYKISKDFTLKNCIKNYSHFSKNLFEDVNGKSFCLSGYKITYPTSNVVLEKKITETNINKNLVSKTEIVIKINNEIYIKNNSVVEHSLSGQKICKTKDETNKIIMRDF